METANVIDQITDMFIDGLDNRYGEDGFEVDVIYVNGTTADDGILIQLWLEWFCGTVYISKTLKAEFSTLIFPYGKISEDNKTVVKKCIDDFNRNSKDAHYELVETSNGIINAYLTEIYVDLDVDIHAAAELLVCCIETISEISCSHYKSIINALEAQ